MAIFGPNFPSKTIPNYPFKRIDFPSKIHLMKRPNQFDIARRAGVGIATVDRVLNGRRKVKAETAERVYQAAIDVGYHAAPLIRHRIDQSAPEMTFGFVLPKQNQPFYASLSKALTDEVTAYHGIRGKAVFRYAKTQSPKEFADHFAALQDKVDVIGASAINHDRVSQAVAAARNAGTPTFAMLNDFALDSRVTYIGLDNYKLGRLAGWIMTNVVSGAGTIAVLVGSSLWHGHQLRETGLRAYFRERAPNLRLQDTLLNLETRQVTYEVVLEILETLPDLRGIYIAGGGVEGAVQALRENCAPADIKLVVHPLTEEIRGALRDEYITSIISTPVQTLAASLVDEMATFALGKGPQNRPQRLLKPQILFPEYP